MKSFALLTATALAVVSCGANVLTPAPINNVDNAALSAQLGDAPKPTPDAGPSIEVAAATPVTVSGGAGGTCLAVDVLANDGAFIRRGTAGSLSGDVFTVDGVGHDLADVPYSVKPC